MNTPTDPRVYQLQGQLTALQGTLEDAQRQVALLREELRFARAATRAAVNNSASVAALLAISSHNCGGAYCSVCHSHETANDR